MFSNAKSGDRVWDYEKNCWGTIIGIVKNCQFPIRVKFDNDIFENTSYTIEGKESLKHGNPILFWDEIKFEIPEKPFNLEKELRELDRIEFRTGKNNYFLVWSNKLKHIVNSCLSNYQNPFLICFTEESINNFMDNIKGKEITKEQFFTAYKNVFGGI